eukprot:symbB.v1.2.037315.t1/scaffold5477.1/size26719/1
MVKKVRKRENRKLAIVQSEKIKKRLRDKRDAYDLAPPKPGTSFKHIKNKQKRSQMVQLMKQEKRKQKSKVRRAKKEREARGEKVDRPEPRTIEKMREFGIPLDERRINTIPIKRNTLGQYRDPL